MTMLVSDRPFPSERNRVIERRAKKTQWAYGQIITPDNKK